MKPTAEWRRLGGAVALLAALGCADGDSSLAPSAAEATYDLALQLDFIFVVGHCEEAPDDPGEFAYRIRLEAPRQSQRYATADFPEQAGAVSYLEGESYDIARELALRAVPWTERDSVLLRFTAVEFDAGGPDARMATEEVVLQLTSRAARFEQPISVRLGFDVACQLLLSARPAWTFNQRGT